MFDLSMSELLVTGVVAVVVIGPKDLPRTMMTVGRWVGKARGVSRNLRAGFDAMVREAEMQELEKHWAEQNEQIMREHPADEPPLAIEPAEQMVPLGGTPEAPPLPDPDEPPLPFGEPAGSRS